MRKALLTRKSGINVLGYCPMSWIFCNFAAEKSDLRINFQQDKTLKKTHGTKV